MLTGGTWRPNLQSSQLAAFAPGDRHYVTSEDDGRTYLATLDSGGALSTVFAERGGTSVVADAAGNVYVASGQIWIYDQTASRSASWRCPSGPVVWRSVVRTSGRCSSARARRCTRSARRRQDSRQGCGVN